MICSWETLLSVLTKKAKVSGIIAKVEEPEDDETKVKICYENNKEFLLEWMNECLKNSFPKNITKSQELRLDGNVKFRQGHTYESLQLYTQSIVVAPYESEELKLSLANRSAALYELKHYDESSRDIDLALSLGLPESIKCKLFLRKGRILYELKKYTKAFCILNGALELFSGSSDRKQNEKLLKDISCLHAEVKSKTSSCDQKVPNELNAEPLIPQPKGGESKILPGASAHLELKESVEKGRYIVTNCDIQLGDILFAEKPFAHVVLPDQYHQHCHHCCKKFIAPLPCAHCTLALYCSETCRLESWQKYHLWECGGLILFHNVGIAHLGLRVALVSSSVSESERFHQVYNLVTHTEDMMPDDLYQYALTAVLMNLYLKYHTTYFSAANKNGYSFQVMGGHILHHIAQMICNGHAITKVDFTNMSTAQNTVSEEKQRIATAIYPSASMMNHSCEPNITNSFVNDYLIVQASKNISKGEEVFNCYGPHFQNSKLRDRQEILRGQYFFECKCVRCSSNEEFLNKFEALKCQQCSGPVYNTVCTECRSKQDCDSESDICDKLNCLYKLGKDFEAKEMITDAIKCFEECVSFGKTYLHNRNYSLCVYMDCLAKLYAHIENYEKSVSLLEECLPTIEEKYGSYSPAVFYEMRKIFDILTALFLSSQMTDVGKRSIQDKARMYILKMKHISQVNCSLNEDLLMNEVCQQLDVVQLL